MHEHIKYIQNAHKAQSDLDVGLKKQSSIKKREYDPTSWIWQNKSELVLPRKDLPSGML